MKVYMAENLLKIKLNDTEVIIPDRDSVSHSNESDHAKNADLSLEANHSKASDSATNATNSVNAQVSDKLKTPRTISLSGGVSGSATFDGSSNITINTTVNSSGMTGRNTGTRPGATYILGDASISVSGNTITLSRSYQVDANTIACSSNCSSAGGCGCGSESGPSNR